MNPMQVLEESVAEPPQLWTGVLPVSVVIAARDEARNLGACLESLRTCTEIFVIDSFSTDETANIARLYGAKVVQFDYRGGWPKKRQWALDTLKFQNEWILLLDADERLTPALCHEIERAIANPGYDGYFIALRMHFLGRTLDHGDTSFYKLSLFRVGKGRFECRLTDQNSSMGDMEVHEHVIVDGPTSTLKNFLIHHNIESLSHYIRKHDQYSNWECRVLSDEGENLSSIPASLWGGQAQRRRWLKKKLYRVPGSPFLLFLYRYLFRLGFLDGIPGLIYCATQGIQLFHTKAKMYELRVQRQRRISVIGPPMNRSSSKC